MLRFRPGLLLRLSKDPDLLEPLRNKNLACWCRLGEPCHADVLLDLSNSNNQHQTAVAPRPSGSRRRPLKGPEGPWPW